MSVYTGHTIVLNAMRDYREGKKPQFLGDGGSHETAFYKYDILAEP